MKIEEAIVYCLALPPQIEECVADSKDGQPVSPKHVLDKVYDVMERIESEKNMKRKVIRL